jgi:hypothetical protein
MCRQRSRWITVDAAAALRGLRWMRRQRCVDYGAEQWITPAERKPLGYTCVPYGSRYSRGTLHGIRCSQWYSRHSKGTRGYSHGTQRVLIGVLTLRGLTAVLSGTQRNSRGYSGVLTWYSRGYSGVLAGVLTRSRSAALHAACAASAALAGPVPPSASAVPSASSAG